MNECKQLDVIKKNIKKNLSMLKSRSTKTGQILSKSFRYGLTKTEEAFIAKNKKINKDIEILRKEGMKVATKCYR